MVSNTEIRIDIKGIDELLQFFDDFPEEAKDTIKKYLKKEANQFIITPLRGKLGYIKDSNKATVLVSKTPLSVIAGVSKKWPGYKANWTQEGTKERVTKKGANRGKIEGRDELTPIIEGCFDPIIDDIQENMEKDIEQIVESKLKSNNRKLKKLLK